MNEFVVEWDYNPSMYIMIVIIIINIIGLIIGLKKDLEILALYCISIIGICIFFSVPISELIATDYMKKEALKRLNPIWLECVENKEVSDVPVRSTDIDGDYIKIRLVNDEVYNVPFIQIGKKDYKRKVIPKFYKSIKPYEMYRRPIIPIKVH